MASGSGSGSREITSEIDPANIIMGKRMSPFRSPFPSIPKSPRSSFGGRRDLPAATTREEGADDMTEEEVVEMLRRYANRGGSVQICAAKAMKTSDAKLSAARDHLGHVPSDLTLYANWSLHQVDSPEYLCYRPPWAVPPVPLTILYEPFANFTQNLEGVISQKDLEFAQTFWDGVQDAEYVTDHKAKVLYLTELLGDYLDRNVAAYAKILGADKKGFVEADGILLGQKRVPILALEWKAEPGKSGDPYFEALDYVKRAAAGIPLYHTYALVICIQGPWLSVSAASVQGVDNKAKVWAQPLTETRCFGDWKALEKTARIWRAVLSFVNDVERLGPLPRSPPAAIPWLLKNFTEVKRPSEKRLFFTYINAQGMQEAAKFVLSYGQEAHQAWSGFAPELKSVQALGTDWKLVTMEYLAPENGWMCAEDVVKSILEDQDQAKLNKFHACVAAAAEAGHSKGYVHGDFRLCNIMARVATEGYEVKVVDFDWSGEEGTVLYPTMVSRKVKWHDEVCFGALVRKEHDLHFIDSSSRLVEQLLT